MIIKKLFSPLFAVILAAALIFVSHFAHAAEEEGLAVMKASDCFTCHRVAQKLIGPSYKDVATKYKGADDVKITELAKKVIAGGVGVWGTVPMRAHPQLTEDDAKKAVRWVLSLADAPAATGTTPATTTPAPAAGTIPAPTTTAPAATTPAPTTTN